MWRNQAWEVETGISESDKGFRPGGAVTGCFFILRAGESL